MPTLKELEARLKALEQRILPALTAERTPETRELEARVNEQIRALQQQQTEQQRQMLIDRNATSALLHTQDKILVEISAIKARIDRMDSILQLILQTLNERLPKKEE